jgi:hypothetical protein
MKTIHLVMILHAASLIAFGIWALMIYNQRGF